jgi:hypothetical protein
VAAFPRDGYSMAADPDSFEDDCQSDGGTLSGDDGDNSEDSEEVQSLLTSIQSARVEQSIRNTGGGEPITVSFCLSLLNTAHDSLLYYSLLFPHRFLQCLGTDHSLIL